jgi:RNase P subunit RPR2
MAKKTKNDAPNPNRVANREVMQRLNYLYQASVYLNSISATEGQDDYLQKISGHYIRSMKQLANKKVVKM